MRHRLQQFGINRKFLIWMLLLLVAFPVLIGIVVFSQVDPVGPEANERFGYAVMMFLVGVIVSGLYMLGVGLPVAAIVWVGLFALLRRWRRSPRMAATLAGAAASLAGAVPAGAWLGVTEFAQLVGVSLVIGGIPCVISIIYFLFAYRGISWQTFAQQPGRLP